MARRYEPRCPKCGQLGSHLVCPSCRKAPINVAAATACLAAGLSIEHRPAENPYGLCPTCGDPNKRGECRPCRAVRRRLRELHGE